MPDARHDAILAGRRIVRTLKSSPDPLRDARALHAALAGATGWSFRERREIEQFRQSLDARPSDQVLRNRCDQLLGQLAAWRT